MNIFDSVLLTLSASPFGQIAPSGPLSDPNPVAGISRLMIFGIQILLLIASITLLIYLLWGAYDWVASNGDPDNLTKARAKMTNAVLGMVLIVAALGIFVVVSQDVLGIITRDAQGNWIFKLPTLSGQKLDSGAACTVATQTQCKSGVCVASGADPGWCL
jgi:magnesium-transporting ATPase (P-type)